MAPSCDCARVTNLPRGAANLIACPSVPSLSSPLPLAGAWDNRQTPGNLSVANSDFLGVTQGNTAGTCCTAVSSSGFSTTPPVGNAIGPFTTVPTRTTIANIPAVVFDYRLYNTPQRLGTLANNALFAGLYGGSNWWV